MGNERAFDNDFSSKKFGRSWKMSYLCSRFMSERLGQVSAKWRFASRWNPKTIQKQMYVIAEIQGQQFKVEEGKKLYIHHMQNVETGATVEIEKVLLADNDGVLCSTSVVARAIAN